MGILFDCKISIAHVADGWIDHAEDAHSSGLRFLVFDLPLIGAIIFRLSDDGAPLCSAIIGDLDSDVTRNALGCPNNLLDRL